MGVMTAIVLTLMALAIAYVIPPAAPFILLGLGITGLSIVGNGAIAGLRSVQSGSCFVEGFAGFINGNWAQSVALGVVVSLVTLGVAKGISAAAVKKAGAKKQLASAANSLNDGLGIYVPDGGHHPMIAEAFRGLPSYSYNNSLAISHAKLGTFVSGMDGAALHAKITGKQMSLYKKNFVKGQTMTLNDMVQIEIDAMTMVGVPVEYATHAVNKAVAQLKSWGVQPIKIPWVR